MISVNIVEDNHEFRYALRMSIESEPDMRVTALFERAEDFLDHLRDETPDVVIMDINLPGISGVEAVYRLKERKPGIEVMMCTVYDDDVNIFTSLQAGACGYILKTSTVDEIVSAVREAVSGGAPMTPGIARKALGFFRNTARPAVETAEHLTKRELEILDLLGAGKTYQQISDALFISLGTTQSHIKNIYRKLHVHSRAEIHARLSVTRPSRKK